MIQRLKTGLMALGERSGIGSLETREKYVLIAGLLFLAVFLVVQVAVVPFFNARDNLEKAIGRKKQELVKMSQLQKEYQQLKQEEGTIPARVNERKADFTLFTFLDQQAEQVKVKKQISYMKPSTVEGEGDLSESMVEMKFQQITLDALVSFLLLVESAENVVFLRRISIQESGKEQGYLDAILQVVTFEIRKQV